MLITGNTYPHRAELRAMGGEWNAGAKGWEVPQERAEEARALVAGGVGQSPRRGRSYGRGGQSRYGSGYVCRCEDAPCCGCGS